jgi:hypothetical protein
MLRKIISTSELFRARAHIRARGMGTDTGTEKFSGEGARKKKTQRRGVAETRVFEIIALK